MRAVAKTLPLAFSPAFSALNASAPRWTVAPATAVLAASFLPEMSTMEIWPEASTCESVESEQEAEEDPDAEPAVRATRVATRRACWASIDESFGAAHASALV